MYSPPHHHYTKTLFPNGDYYEEMEDGHMFDISQTQHHPFSTMHATPHECGSYHLPSPNKHIPQIILHHHNLIRMVYHQHTIILG